MPLTYRSHETGLVLAEHAEDERAVAAALKRLDSRLVLQKHRRDDAPGGWVWKVVCVVSDTYAPIVFTWTDEQGRALPLSSALVDEVQRHTLGARNRGPDADEHNRRLIAEKARDDEREREAIKDDHRARLERGRVCVMMATVKKPRYWQREGRRPGSAR